MFGKKSKKNNPFYRLGVLVARARILYLEGLNSQHLRIRKLHDVVYSKGGTYKKWTDQKYSSIIHKTVLVSFISSFIIFSVLQSVFPFFNLGSPTSVQAGANSVTWTTDSHFNNNGPDGANYTGATTKAQASVTGDAISLADPLRQIEVREIAYNIYGVYFPDASNGFAVGHAGTILKTTNAGASWTSLNSGITSSLNDVYFIDSSIGYAVGLSGTILKTTNAGASWTALTSGTTSTFYGVNFTDLNTGYTLGSGGTILKTTNAGASWTALTSGTSAILRGLHFTDSSTGYAIGLSGTILKTTNAGASWTALTSGTSNAFYGVNFTDSNTGYAVGVSGTIRKTTNAGASWTALNAGTTATLMKVYFTDSNTGYALGSGGTILKTTNAGANWSALTSSTTLFLYGLHFTDNNNVYAVGQSGSIFRTTNAGASWTSITSGVSNTNTVLRAAHFTDINTGYVVGDSGTIRKTTNAGATWTALTSGTTSVLYAIHFTDVNNGYVAGQGGTIRKTTNAGASWTALSSGTTNNLNAVYFVNVNTGYAVGGAGTILKTIDAGANWTALTSGTVDGLNGVQFIDASVGYAVGIYGRVLKTTDAGANWTALTSGTASSLNGVNFTDADTGYAVGTSGTIRKTTDAGANWTALTPGITSNLSAVYFVNANTGYAVGQSGSILMTNNAGANWTPLLTGVNSGLFAIDFTDSNTGYVTGENGLILKVTPSYPSPGTISGFKINAGDGSRARWNSISWNSSALPSTTAINFRVRASNDNSGWSSWTSYASQITPNSTSGSGDLAVLLSSLSPPVTSSQWLEAELRLDGVNSTPTLNDFTVTYDTLESPTITPKKTDDSFLTEYSGTLWTNESSLNVVSGDITCDGCGTSDGRYIEAQASTDGTGFTSPISANGSVQVEGSPSVATISGLAPGSAYHIRARSVDAQGRVSAWTVFDKTVTVDQSPPTGTLTIDQGVFTTQTTVGLTLSATDTGDSSPTKTDLKYRLSNNGQIWTDWTDYPANDTVPDWDLTLYGGSVDDGEKNVYVQYRDNAGNVSGDTYHTATSDFGGVFGSTISNANDELKLASYYRDAGGTDWINGYSGDTYSPNFTDEQAEQVRVNWDYDGCIESAGCQIYLYVDGIEYLHIAGESGQNVDSGWLNGTSIQGLITADLWGAGGQFKFNKVEFRLNGYPVSATYTSAAIVNPGLFTTINWSDKTTTPNSGSVAMKVIGGDDANMSNSVTSLNLNKGDMIPESIRNKPYLKYEITISSGNNQTETPLVFDVSIGGAPFDSITLDTQPPANVINLRAYNSSAKTSQYTSGSWYTNATPYYEWDAVADADLAGYAYCTVSGCTPDPNGSNIIAKTTTNFTPTAYTTDGMKYFRLIAFDGAKNPSVEVIGFNYGYDGTPPPRVTGLRASTTLNDRINLNWNIVSDAGSPAENYQIQRIRYNQGSPGCVVSNTAIWNEDCLGFKQYITATGTQIAYSDLDIQLGIKYVYRIKVKDLAYPEHGDWNLTLAEGYTLDTAPPTIIQGADPAYALACDGIETTCPETDPLYGTTNQKGFSVKITWGEFEDVGSGLSHYKIYRATTNSTQASDWQVIGVVDLEQTQNRIWYDNDQSNQLTFGTDKPSPTEQLNDYTIYYYRITAVDMATDADEELSPNESSLFLPPPNVLNNLTTAQTPDVTSPQAPTELSVTAVGLDAVGQGSSEPENMQQINISWAAAFDVKARSTHGVGDWQGSGIAGYKLYRSSGGDFTEVSTVETVTCDFVERICSDTALNDRTSYTYRMSAYDNDGNPDSALSSPVSATTFSGDIPLVPQGINVQSKKGNSATDAEVGKRVNLKFNGSRSKNYKIVKYEVYRSTTNYVTNTEWLNQGNKLKLTQANCQLGGGLCFRVDDNGGDILVNPESGDDRDMVYEVHDLNLSSETGYYYRVRAQDNTPPPAEFPEQGNFYSGLSAISTSNLYAGWDITPDINAPALPSGLKVKDIHGDGTNYLRNIVTWERIANPSRNGTNDFKEYKLYRSNDGITFSQILVGGQNPLANADQEMAMATNYYMDLIPVASSNQYFYYYVTSVDNAGTDYKYSNNTVINPSYSNESKPARNSENNIVAVSLNPYIAKPTILNVASGAYAGKKASLSDVSVSSAVITWRTDQSADSLIEYRKKGTSDPFIAVGNRDMLTNHSVRIFDLTPTTEYEYRVISRNYLANDAIAEGAALPALKTSSFTISAGAVNATTSTVEINWTTNIDAKSNFVEWQMQRQPGDDPQSGIAGELGESHPLAHKVVIKGLRSGRKYTYKIKSISNDDFLTETGFLEFTTRSFDSSQFIIEPSSSNVAERNISATSAQIVWETGMAATSWVDFGTKSGQYDYSAGDDILTRTHVVKLENLASGTTYYYRVRVKDSNEVEYVSKEYSFRAIAKPKIENITIKEITPYYVVIAWETNVDTDTLLNWGTSEAYGERVGKAESTKNHELKVENLTDDTEYHYQIVARDEHGNEVVDEDKVVRTPLDKEGPKVEEVKIDILPLGEDSQNAQVIISWKTNKPATRLVQYDEGVVGGRYGKSSIKDDSFNNSHTVIIKDLLASTTYHFRIVAEDKRGNETITNDYTFVTPTTERSILQLIIKSLEETFAWVANVGSFFGGLREKI